MKINTLLESLDGCTPKVLKTVINEAPHFTVVGEIPDALAILGLGSFVDLGVEDWPVAEFQSYMSKLVGVGLNIPGTDFRIRMVAVGRVKVEDAIPEADSLPEDWLHYVVVINNNRSDVDYVVYFGDKVRSDRRPISIDRYSRVASGFVAE